MSDESTLSNFGYRGSFDENALPVAVPDAPVPTYTPASHNPPGTEYGLPEGYPTAAGPVYNGEKK